MKFSADWFSQNIPNWTLWLKELKDKPDLKFLEVGCFEGKATLWLCDNILTHPNSEIHTIDTFGGGMEDGDKGAFYAKDAYKNYQENIKDYFQIITHPGESGEVLRGFADYESFDFVYIDGSHRSAEVLEDTILAWRLLKRGGILIWDDFGLRRYADSLLNPGTGINAFLGIFKGKYEMIGKGYQLCVKKL